MSILRAGDSPFVLGGRFLVQRRLGSGGMGDVYEARDLSRDVPVALKTLPRLDPAALYRFKQEFRLLAGITHPNLAALHELVNADDQWFLTMEVVEGVDFLHYVRPPSPAGAAASTPVAPDSDETVMVHAVPTGAPSGASDQQHSGDGVDFSRLRSALRQLVGALSALHAADRLHLDIKPSNVLVTPEGRVVVLDFGLVVDRSRGGGAGDEPITGTVAFMAPEQAAGVSLTPAADWYAVGAMLYLALAGRLPFDGPMLEVLAAKSLTLPDPPSRWNPAVPDSLDQLCLRLLAPKPEERAGAAEVRAAAVGKTAVALEGPAARLLIGREAELAALRDAFDASAGRRPVTVFVHGASGMGKSALVEGFLDTIRTRRDVLILSGRCYEQESVQYKALDGLIDALSRHLRLMPDSDLRAVLPRDVALLARMFPVLDRVDAVRLAPRTALSISSEQELRDRAFDTLRAVLAALAGRARLVLSIDDLQWGDTDSARLLADILHRVEAPLLFIGGYRTDYATTSACLRTLLADDRDDRAGTGTTARSERRVIALGPLDAADAARVALLGLGAGVPMADATAARIAHESAGSPSFIRELVDYVLTELQFTDPGSLVEGITYDEALRRRLGRLKPAARRLLEVIAVASRPIGEADAYAAADLSARDPALLGVLRNSHLVQSGGIDDPHVETYHDRIREAVLAQLGAGPLRQTHRRLADTLDARGGVDPEWLGAHLEGAGDAQRASDCYARAAAGAAGALAFDRAAELYRRSLEIGQAAGADTLARRVALGDALASAGRGAEAAVEFGEAARTAPADEVLDLQRRAGYQLCISGRLAEGRALLSQCLERVGITLPSSPKRALLPLAILYARLRVLEWSGRLERLPAPRTLLPAERATLDVVWAAAAALTDVDVILAAVMQARYLLMARKLGDPGKVARGLVMFARWLAAGGPAQHQRTLRLVAAARQMAEVSGGHYERAMAIMAEAHAHLDVYEWAEGFQRLDECEEMLRTHCTGVVWELGLVRMTRLSNLRVRGLYRECIEYGHGVLAEARQRGDVYTHHLMGMFVIPDERTIAGDPAGALQALRQIGSRSMRRHFPNLRVMTCLGLVSSDVALGRGERAWRRCRRSWPVIKSDGTFRIEMVAMLAWLVRATAALAAIADRPGQSAELIREAERAITALERFKTGMPRAVALNVRGSVAVHQGDRGRALALFDQAGAWFEARGLRSFAAAARRCQGLLLGGGDGRRMVDEADRWFRDQGFASLDYATTAHVGSLPREFLQMAEPSIDGRSE